MEDSLNFNLCSQLNPSLQKSVLFGVSPKICLKENCIILTWEITEDETTKSSSWMWLIPLKLQYDDLFYLFIYFSFLACRLVELTAGMSWQTGNSRPKQDLVHRDRRSPRSSCPAWSGCVTRLGQTECSSTTLNTMCDRQTGIILKAVHVHPAAGSSHPLWHLIHWDARMTSLFADKLSPPDTLNCKNQYVKGTGNLNSFEKYVYFLTCVSLQIWC